MTLKFQVKPYNKVPKRLRNTPRLTVEQILEKVLPATKKRSRVVRINGARVARTPKFLPGWTVYRVDTQNTENRHRYIITIFTPTTLIRKDTKIIVDSPNPLFVFRYEWAMAKRGNAFIYRSNGQPPVQTNPGGRPGLDHHAYAALRFLLKESRRYAKEMMSKASKA